MKTAIELIASITDRMHVLTGTCEMHGTQDAWLPNGVTEWKCPDCAEAAHVAASREKAADERRATLIKFATVPARYAGQTFHASTDAQRDARKNARSFMGIAIAGDVWAALVLSGEAGTGKTLMACEMIERFIHRTMRSARYITAVGMIGEIHEAYGKTSDKSEAGEIRRFSNYDLLVLDELDLVRSNDNTQGLLTEVINARYNAGKPTIAITNTPRDEIGKYVGSRVDDRLYENGYLALFTWPSFRRVSGQ